MKISQKLKFLIIMNKKKMMRENKKDHRELKMNQVNQIMKVMKEMIVMKVIIVI